MPLFYFDLHECGLVIPDEDGVERPDPEAARLDAIEAARDVMAAEAKQGRLCLSCRIEVRDEEGRTVLSVPFRDAIEITGL